MAAAAVFKQMTEGLDKMSDAERTKLVGSTKAVFVFNIKDKNVQHTLNLKEGKGSSTEGVVGKPDITIEVNEADFVQLAQGKLNGQKAFSTGKLKIKGNMMLAMKLDKILYPSLHNHQSRSCKRACS
ncbi:SCP2 sterol-binding domain-containing protein [Syncephalis plumigaleata]|nr:SCP2 sterol-binding domain-containing protein [Syncephalis plumigaleata]